MRIFIRFWQSYFYLSLGSDDKTFHAPEQLGQIEANIDIRADIFSFGLCMLSLLFGTFEDFSFDEIYTVPSDLDKVYEKIREYELESSENEIFLLVMKMTAFNPNDRISLDDLGIKLRKILKQNKQNYIFELNLSKGVIEKYIEIHNDDDITSHINERISSSKSYWDFGNDKSGEREEIKIACGDLVFCCSAKESPYLFCFSILEKQKILDELYRKGLEFDNDFIITTGRNHSYECDDIQDIKDALKENFIRQQNRNKRLEIDKKAIYTEEELLRAEKETIDLKKNVTLALFKSFNRAKDTITFECINTDDEKDKEKKEELNTILQTAISKQFKNLKKEKNKNQEFLSKARDFQNGDSVVIENANSELLGNIASQNPAKKEITIKLDKYDTNKIDESKWKNSIHTISYDYQVEENLWIKKDDALSLLTSGQTTIPNLLRKINEPKELKENVLVQIDEFFDKNLDENQKEAVIKAMSLDSESEILLIQGPPGTGKTTTITEMIRQILKRHRHYRILVASQSNQAVDNVLEKICEYENKIWRIGKENKMSDIAKQFSETKVLNKLIKDNRERIKANPISDENPQIDKKLKELQMNFDRALQTITAEMAENKKSNNNQKTKNEQLATLFLKNIRLVFGTLLGISSWKYFRDIAFDFAIVDEAGRATLSELLVPCIKARKIVLVGDHKQLAPVIDDEVASNLKDFTKKEVGTSFFERLFERLKIVPYLDNFCHRLIYNYRAEHTICQLYSQAFYEGELKEPEAIKDKRAHNLPFKSSAVWIDTSKLDNREDSQVGTGKINKCNVKWIESTLSILLDHIEKSKLAHSIGIITPYKAQAQLLQDRTKQLKNRYKIYYQSLKNVEDKDLRNGFDIGTVDSFQGSDRDIIIYDCVRSSKAKNSKDNKEKSGAKITFIADEKRLNVSLSRAKKLLIIVGDMEFLYGASVSEGINPFVTIIEYMRKHKEDYEMIDMSKIIDKEK
ncbi:AAA domain-containing protein [Helicobacter sp. 23-1046]